jgi:hypothetical protein
MDEKLIYKKFIKATNEDPRYLRPDRWREILAIINQYKLKSALEFGAGVSTMLFRHHSLSVVSCETDMAYMRFVQDLAGNDVDFRVWDNNISPIKDDERFDFGLVDGCLPRNRQAEIAIKCCRFVALDDSVRDIKRSLWSLLSPFERVDKDTTIISIFKII